MSSITGNIAGSLTLRSDMVGSGASVNLMGNDLTEGIENQMADANPYETPRAESEEPGVLAERNGLRVKIFTKLNPKNKVEPVNEQFEAEINEWLRSHPNIMIRHIQQSAGAGSMGPFLFCITVWYEWQG